MRPFLSRLVRDETGATALEYAILVALIGVLIIGSLATFGVNLKGSYSQDSNAIR